MKWLSRIIAAGLFIFFFILALKNTQETALYFFWGYELRGPLVLIVLCFFLAGAVLGLLAMIPTVFRSRLELSRQKKKLNEIMQVQEAQKKTSTEPTSGNTVSDGKPSETQTD